MSTTLPPNASSPTTATPTARKTAASRPAAKKRPAQAAPAAALPVVQPIALDDGRVRVVIEGVHPAVDDGRFAIKRVLGDRVEVEADCFADGHDLVACALLWRVRGAAQWQRTPMQPLGNDRWRAAFVVDALGTWEYTVCA